MNYFEEWKVLSARINGHIESSKIYFQALGAAGIDYNGIANNYLLHRLKDLVNDSLKFKTDFNASLPEEAKKSLGFFLAKYEIEMTGISGIQAMMVSSTMLATLDADVSFHLNNTDTKANTLVERALLHIQRTIVVDGEEQKKWIRAFDEGEISCEKLGATHLLGFGIWAFKVDAKGERTDLVLNSKPLENEVVSSGSFLVLTEWKLLKNEKERDACIHYAIAQAKRYTQGSLAGYEVFNTRYIIVVTKKHLAGISDVTDGPFRYRIINLAVEPEPPSRANVPQKAPTSLVGPR